MPISNPEPYPWIARQICDIRPQKTLDVGCGIGVYGLAVRAFGGDVEGGGRPDFRSTGTFRHYRVDGLDIDTAYMAECPWRSIYTRVRYGDLYDLVDELLHYDLILCVDVLPYIERVRATRILPILATKTDHLILTFGANKVRADRYAGRNSEEFKATWHRREIVDMLEPADFQATGWDEIEGLRLDFVVEKERSTGNGEQKADTTHEADLH